MTSPLIRSGPRKGRGGRPSAEEAAMIADRILDAAWAMTVEQGFDSLSYDRLAVEASAGKATIYARFQSKTVLARAMLERRIDRLEEEFEAGLPRRDGFEAELALLAERVSSLMGAPEGRAIERLVDWLMLADPVAGREARAWLYGRSNELISRRLARLAERWGRDWPDPEAAGNFWLESVFGHARMSESGEGLADWSQRHARLFASAFAGPA